jgi:hypothetical protein
MASHGYLCISLADTNGGGVYTELPDGTPINMTLEMDPNKGLFNLDLTKKATQARVNQNTQLIDELGFQTFT